MMVLYVILLMCVIVATLAAPNRQISDYAEKFPNTGRFYPLDDVRYPSGMLPDLNMGQNSMMDRSRRWENGIIPYTINDPAYDDEHITNITRALSVMEELMRTPDGEYCIRMPVRTDQRDYVEIAERGGCWSFIGQLQILQGKQQLSLDIECLHSDGITQHEFLHAYGFNHEQVRGDRDDYVFVNWDNIEPGMEGNFVMKIEGETIDHLGTEYDYGSVMHYPPYGFAIDPTIPTLIPLDPDVEIGQVIGPSETDIERVQIFYECITPEESKHFQHLIGKELFY